MNGGAYRLGIDFGTSTTVAALAGPDGRVRSLLFDGSPLLPSAVYADPAMGLLVGADAVRAAVGSPAGFEGNPKRRVDEGTVWLGEREYPVADLVAAVLRRVGAEASRVAGGPVDEVVLTHPAAWGRTRLSVLTAAAERAGLGTVRFVPEPVAAAAYFATVLGPTIPAERVIVVYDLGAGTFDVSVVRPSPGGFDVVATDGLPDVGGVDLDAAVVGHVRTRTASATTAWQRLDWPQNPADQQARQTLWQAARAVKEQLSRHPTGELHVPLVDQRIHLTREEFEKAARGQLDRTAALTLTVLRAAGIPPEQVAAVYLVGGSSRIPLAATLLHRTLRIAPTILDQPELVVAEGALHNHAAPAPVTATVPMPAPAPAPPPPLHPAAAGPTRRRVPVALLVALAAVVLLLTGGGILAVTRPWAHPADTGNPNVFPTETSGTWAGLYQQSDGHASQIELAINAGTATAQVRYPGLGCLGTVTVLSRTGTSVRAQERISSGRCTLTGIMSIQPQPGGQLSVFYTPDLATYTATALLSRR